MPDFKNVLVLFSMDDECKKRLESIYPEAEYTYSTYKEVTKLMIDQSEVILGSAPPDMVKNAKRLKWLQMGSAGSDHFQKSGMFPQNAILTNASGGYGLAISEHMLGLTLMVMKKLDIYRDNQSKQLWQDEGEILSIYGSTALIIGLGDIGSEFAKRLNALGANVIGVKRSAGQKPDYVDELYTADKIDELIPRADIVALAVPKTDDTNKILSAGRIAALKPKAVVINVGRGTAVDTEALADALMENRIFGAGLDVTDPEPLPEGHRLWSAPNAVITPHISGGHNHLPETYRRILEICFYNYEAFVNGRQMKNVVDFNRGY